MLTKEGESMRSVCEGWQGPVAVVEVVEGEDEGPAASICAFSASKRLRRSAAAAFCAVEDVAADEAEFGWAEDGDVPGDCAETSGEFTRNAVRSAGNSRKSFTKCL
jgi:hypothetical protein